MSTGVQSLTMTVLIYSSTDCCTDPSVLLKEGKWE